MDLDPAQLRRRPPGEVVGDVPLQPTAPPAEPPPDYAAPISTPRFNYDQFQSSSARSLYRGQIRQQERQDAQIQQDAQQERERQYREGVKAQKEAEETAKKRENSRKEADFRRRGVSYHTDAFGNLIEDRDEAGNVKFKADKSEVQWSGTTGKPFQTVRHETGQTEVIDPDKDAKISENELDPQDPYIYRENKFQPWEAIDPKEGIQSGDQKVKIASAKALFNRKLRELDDAESEVATRLADPDRARPLTPKQRQEAEAAVQSLSAESEKPKPKGGFLGFGESVVDPQELQRWEESEKFRKEELAKAQKILDDDDAHKNDRRTLFETKKAKEAFKKGNVAGFLKNYGKDTEALASMPEDEFQARAQETQAKVQQTVEDVAAARREIADKVRLLDARLGAGLPAERAAELMADRQSLLAKDADLAERHNASVGATQAIQDADKTRREALRQQVSTERQKVREKSPELAPFMDQFDSLDQEARARAEAIQNEPDEAKRKELFTALQADLTQKYTAASAEAQKAAQAKGSEEVGKALSWAVEQDSGFFADLGNNDLTAYFALKNAKDTPFSLEVKETALEALKANLRDQFRARYPKASDADLDKMFEKKLGKISQTVETARQAGTATIPGLKSAAAEFYLTRGSILPEAVFRKLTDMPAATQAQVEKQYDSYVKTYLKVGESQAQAEDHARRSVEAIFGQSMGKQLEMLRQYRNQNFEGVGPADPRLSNFGKTLAQGLPQVPEQFARFLGDTFIGLVGTAAGGGPGTILAAQAQGAYADVLVESYNSLADANEKEKLGLTQEQVAEAAAVSAAAKSGLELASDKLLFGRLGKAFKLLPKDAQAKVLAATAGSYAKRFATQLPVGLAAEIPTEIAQDAIDRAAARRLGSQEPIMTPEIARDTAIAVSPMAAFGAGISAISPEETAAAMVKNQELRNKYLAPESVPMENLWIADQEIRDVSTVPSVKTLETQLKAAQNPEEAAALQERLDAARRSDPAKVPQESRGDLASGLLKLAMGQPMESLPAAERTVVESASTSAGVPFVEVVGAVPVITDIAREWLGTVAPAANSLIGMNESEARAFAAQPQTEGAPNVPQPKPAGSKPEVSSPQPVAQRPEAASPATQGTNETQNESLQGQEKGQKGEEVLSQPVWRARGQNGTEVTVPVTAAKSKAQAQELLATELGKVAPGEMLDPDSVTVYRPPNGPRAVQGAAGTGAEGQPSVPARTGVGGRTQPGDSGNTVSEAGTGTRPDSGRRGNGEAAGLPGTTPADSGVRDNRGGYKRVGSPERLAAVGRAIGAARTRVDRINRSRQLIGRGGIQIVETATGKNPGADMDAKGNITIFVDPDYAARGADIRADWGNGDRWIQDALDEEITHAADLLVAREKWRKAGAPGSAKASWEAERRKDVTALRASLQGKNAEAIANAIVRGFLTYDVAGREIPNAEFEKLVEAIPGKGIVEKAKLLLAQSEKGIPMAYQTTRNASGSKIPRIAYDIDVATEILRQLVQAKNRGEITESGFNLAAKRIMQWLRDTVVWLKLAAETPEIKAITKDIEKILSDAEKVPAQETTAKAADITPASLIRSMTLAHRRAQNLISSADIDPKEMPDQKLVNPAEVKFSGTEETAQDDRDNYDADDIATWPIDSDTANTLTEYKEAVDNFDPEDIETWDPFILPDLGNVADDVQDQINAANDILENISDAPAGYSAESLTAVRNLKTLLESDYKAILDRATSNKDAAQRILDEVRTRAEAWLNDPQRDIEKPADEEAPTEPAKPVSEMTPEERLRDFQKLPIEQQNYINQMRVQAGRDPLPTSDTIQSSDIEPGSTIPGVDVRYDGKATWDNQDIHFFTDISPDSSGFRGTFTVVGEITPEKIRAARDEQRSRFTAQSADIDGKYLLTIKALKSGDMQVAREHAKNIDPELDQEIAKWNKPEELEYAAALTAAHKAKLYDWSSAPEMLYPENYSTKDLIAKKDEYQSALTIPESDIKRARALAEEHVKKLIARGRIKNEDFGNNVDHYFLYSLSLMGHSEKAVDAYAELVGNGTREDIQGLASDLEWAMAHRVPKGKTFFDVIGSSIDFAASASDIEPPKANLNRNAFMFRQAVVSGYNSLEAVPNDKLLAFSEQWDKLSPDEQTKSQSTASDRYRYGLPYGLNSWSGGRSPESFAEDVRGRFEAYLAEQGKSPEAERVAKKRYSLKGFYTALQSVIDWSLQNSRIFNPNLRDLVIGRGGEHSVVYLGDRVLKFTYPDEAGMTVIFNDEEGQPSIAKAEVPEYFDRMAIFNQWTRQDVQIEGIMFDGTKMAIVTSQQAIEGETPNPAEVRRLMEANGFYRLKDDLEYYNPEQNIAIFDAKPMNLAKNGDDIIPIDLIMVRPQGKLRQWALNNINAPDTIQAAGISTPSASQTERADTGNEEFERIEPNAGLWSADIAPFYSQLRRALEQKMPNRAKPEQIMGIVRGAQIKPEELKWSNLEGWLAGRDTISKQDVLNYLGNEGSVRFEEHSISGMTETPPLQWSEMKDNYRRALDESGRAVYWAEFMPSNRMWNINPNIGGQRAYADFDEVKEEVDRAWSNRNPPRIASKYSSYQLPGGESYREVVLAMPESVNRNESLAQQWFKKPYSELDISERDFIVQEAKFDSSESGSGPPKSDYRSSHFSDVPNYVAHMRLNEREDSEGKPGLFIEELQSDRFQSQRKSKNKAREILDSKWVEAITKLKKDGRLKVIC